MRECVSGCTGTGFLDGSLVTAGACVGELPLRAVTNRGSDGQSLRTGVQSLARLTFTAFTSCHPRQGTSKLD